MWRWYFPLIAGVISFCVSYLMAKESKVPVVRRRYEDTYDMFVRDYMRTEKDREKANDRAKRLFLSLLTPEQTKEFTEKGYITVKGGTSNRKYLILQGISGNVYHRHGSKQTAYCCHMRISAPTFDHMIAQMFHLRFNEEVFLKTAYKSTY